MTKSWQEYAMVKVKKEGILFQKTTLGFENEGVLNPAVIKNEIGIHLFYRAVSKGNHSTVGHCKLQDALTVAERFDFPILFPQFDYESKAWPSEKTFKIEQKVKRQRLQYLKVSI